MGEDTKKPVRSWQEIAEEASHERDPQKWAALAQELEEALAGRDKDIHKNLYRTQKSA